MEPNDWEDNPNQKRKNDKPQGDAWRDLTATPQRLSTLFRTNRLPESAWEPAQKLANMIPTGDDWLRFTDTLLVSLGTIFLLVGIVTFFAFNWDDLSRWHRFVIVEGAVVISTILAFVFNLDKWAGRLALGASAILLGVALAVISQEYQTGADSYRLFQVWLMLITGWVLISRWNIMYLIWMVLLNITIGFYWQQAISSDWQTFNLIVLAINAGFVFVWEGIVLKTHFKFMEEGRWFLYIFMVVALTHGTSLMINFILASKWMQTTTLLYPIAYVVLLALLYLFYIILRRDLLMLTFSALSVLVVGITGSGNILWDLIVAPASNNGDSFFSGIAYFFLMAIITIALTALCVTLLRSLHRRWEVNHE